MRKRVSLHDQGKPPAMAELLEQAGEAQQWWGAVTAFLVDSYRVRTLIQWQPQAEAWGETYWKSASAVAHVVPREGQLLVFIPFSRAATDRANANLALLDPAARTAFNTYVAGDTSMPTVHVHSDADVDAITSLVSLAHPRKGHPCGSA